MSQTSSPPELQATDVDYPAQKRPRKRRRVALACNRCRDRKIKCDGVKPTCGSCLLRHPAHDNVPCAYQSDVLKLASEKEYIESLHDRIRQLENGLSQRKSTIPTEGVGEHSNASQPFITQIPDTSTFLEKSGMQSRAYIEDPPATPYHSFQQDRSENFRCNSLSLPAINTPITQASPIDGNESLGSSHRHEQESERTISAMGAAAAADADSPASQMGFYGASSAISFFNQIQETLSGPTRSKPSGSQMRRNPGNRDDRVSRGPFQVESSIKLQDFYLPPRMLSDFLLDSYWNQVHTLYPLIHKSSFLAVYRQLWVAEESTEQTRTSLQIGLGSAACPTSVFYCGLNAMLALGCNLSDMPYEQRRTLSDAFCQRSLDLALGNLLDNSSLALVQALFILGQYLQSTDHPTRCWNVVGLALRVAQGIGLYMDKSSSDSTLLETEIKRRTWHACLLLDIITSMTLGRPALTSREANVPLPAAIDDIYLENETNIGTQPPGIFSENMFFLQTIKLYGIFGDVLTHVYKPWQDRTKDDQHLDARLKSSIIKTVMDLEHALLDFKSNLPAQLNWEREPDPQESWLVTRQRNILYTRFLHLKVLLYRPVFYQLYVQPRRKPLRPGLQSESISHDRTVVALVAQRCGCACIESAQALIDFVDRSSQTKSAGAWWYAIFYMFTSAMILILASAEWSVDNTMSKESVEESWKKCLGTLDRLSLKHIRAKTCAETLIKLREQTKSGNHAPDLDAISGSQLSNKNPIQQVVEHDNTNSNDDVAEEMRHSRQFYDGVVEFYDPLLQDVVWQQPNGQFPWDLDDDWWQGMLERP